jgi:hypothetical protein
MKGILSFGSTPRRKPDESRLRSGDKIALLKVCRSDWIRVCALHQMQASHAWEESL